MEEAVGFGFIRMSAGWAEGLGTLGTNPPNFGRNLHVRLTAAIPLHLAFRGSIPFSYRPNSAQLKRLERQQGR